MGRFRLGDLVEMKKPHPCGANEWEIMRLGMDFRLKCLQCGRLVMLPRSQAEKNIRRVISRCGEVRNN